MKKKPAKAHSNEVLSNPNNKLPLWIFFLFNFFKLLQIYLEANLKQFGFS